MIVTARVLSAIIAYLPKHRCVIMEANRSSFQLITVLLLVTSVRASNDFFIEVVVSPIVRIDIIGEIRLIWESRRFTQGDRIVLYRSGDVVFQYEAQSCSGFIDTGSFVGETNFTQSYTSYCTIYSAAYLQENQTMAYSCLQNSPTWMNDLRGVIQNFTLGELFIPGTHDSASYVVSKTGYFENILQKYVYTQDVSILEQLVMGIRYLDLRIGFYNHTIGEPPFNWWCNHDFMPVQPLSQVLDQIKKFLTNTNEIVIVDFHHFPVGFNDEIHNQLAKYLLKELGELLHKRTDLEFRVTLKSLWSSGRRLVLSYNKDYIANEFAFYPPIKQNWGNKQNLDELYSFLSAQFHECGSERRQKVWAAMAEVTPSTLGVLTDWYGGLRNLANKINTNITLSLRTCRKWSLCSNIIAVDFFRSTGIVSAAVRLNRVRAKAKNGTVAFG